MRVWLGLLLVIIDAPLHGYQLTYYLEENNENNCVRVEHVRRCSVVMKTQATDLEGSSSRTDKCIVKFLSSYYVVMLRLKG